MHSTSSAAPAPSDADTTQAADAPLSAPHPAAPAPGFLVLIFVGESFEDYARVSTRTEALAYKAGLLRAATLFSTSDRRHDLNVYCAPGDVSALLAERRPSEVERAVDAAGLHARFWEVGS